MVDLSMAIVPKSDQLNADDLIGGPITITITEAKLTGAADQPIAIHYQGDRGKPYKPGKSMARVLINAWGKEGDAYAGRQITLYRDPTVKFGTDETGGIRISHMSHISSTLTLALTATRAKRKPYTVKPLASASQPTPAERLPGTDGLPPALQSRLDAAMKKITTATSAEELTATTSRIDKLVADLQAGGHQKQHDALAAAIEAAKIQWEMV